MFYIVDAKEGKREWRTIVMKDIKTGDVWLFGNDCPFSLDNFKVVRNITFEMEKLMGKDEHFNAMMHFLRLFEDFENRLSDVEQEVEEY